MKRGRVAMRVLFFLSTILYCIGIAAVGCTAERYITAFVQYTHTHSTIRTQTIAPPRSTLSKSEINNIITPSSTTEELPELYSVDVRYDRRSPLKYDAASGRYLDNSMIQTSSADTNSYHGRTFIQKFGHSLHRNFVPEGVTPSYYKFMRWRILQRFINANVHVIGTQSLLMGLRGIQRSGAVSAVSGAAVKGGAALGAVAATNWVLKDTLGKFVRMVWASKMGRKFDPDAKRWRYRASFIYALGNGLEVSTYLHPQYFLPLAMLANSCKQMSMLTSSATRNALYNSFKGDGVVNVNTANGSGDNNGTAIRRSGSVENIGDITAKGEAQIAVVDLLGIASGICLSRAVGVSVNNVFSVWVILQVMEIFCMYHEMQSIVYSTLNFERMHTVLREMKFIDDNSADVVKPPKTKKEQLVSNVPTPEDIAEQEKIFMPPDHLARRAIAFGSPGRTALDPDELKMLVNDAFRGEKYFIVVGKDEKNTRGLSARVRQWRRMRRAGISVEKGVSLDYYLDPQEQCYIVLHESANNLDILKSALALVIFRRKLVALDATMRQQKTSVDDPPPPFRTRDCQEILRETRIEASKVFPHLLRELTKKGWRPPLRSLLGRVSARADWKIQLVREKKHHPAS
mmetsp:Transcript_28729/g.44390  ORF Transcript_28729/g.44390 Transcript_28729/m.44390 type:complete len:629 (+) Transcript_28729:212-2098(+)